MGKYLYEFQNYAFRYKIKNIPNKISICFSYLSSQQLSLHHGRNLKTMAMTASFKNGNKMGIKYFPYLLIILLIGIV